MQKKIILFRQNLLGSKGPFLEPIQFFVLGACLSYGKPSKTGRINQRRDSSNKIERSYFIFGYQPDAFCSERAHQWLSGDLTEDHFSAHNY